MSKVKAIIIDLIVMAALGAMLWGLWNGAIRSFYVMLFIFGAFGYLSVGTTLYSWLMAPSIMDRPESILPAWLREITFGEEDEDEDEEISPSEEKLEGLSAQPSDAR